MYAIAISLGVVLSKFWLLVGSLAGCLGMPLFRRRLGYCVTEATRSEGRRRRIEGILYPVPRPARGTQAQHTLAVSCSSTAPSPA